MGSSADNYDWELVDSESSWDWELVDTPEEGEGEGHSLAAGTAPRRPRPSWDHDDTQRYNGQDGPGALLSRCNRTDAGEVSHSPVDRDAPLASLPLARIPASAVARGTPQLGTPAYAGADRAAPTVPGKKRGGRRAKLPLPSVSPRPARPRLEVDVVADAAPNAAASNRATVTFGSSSRGTRGAAGRVEPPPPPPTPPARSSKRRSVETSAPPPVGDEPCHVAAETTGRLTIASVGSPRREQAMSWTPIDTIQVLLPPDARRILRPRTPRPWVATSAGALTLAVLFVGLSTLLPWFSHLAPQALLCALAGLIVWPPVALARALMHWRNGESFPATRRTLIALFAVGIALVWCVRILWPSVASPGWYASAGFVDSFARVISSVRAMDGIGLAIWAGVELAALSWLVRPWRE